MCLFVLRETEQEHAREQGLGQRERDRETLKQSPHPAQRFKVMTEQK